jgi:hypothetical protein
MNNAFRPRYKKNGNLVYYLPIVERIFSLISGFFEIQTPPASKLFSLLRKQWGQAYTVDNFSPLLQSLILFSPISYPLPSLEPTF